MKESGLILNQEILLSAYEISKKVVNLLRRSQKVQREEDGAVQFWGIKNNLQDQFPQVLYWSESPFNHQQWTDTWRSEFKQETYGTLFAD